MSAALTPVFIRGMKDIPERRKSVEAILRQVPEASVVWDTTRNAMDTWCKSLEAAGDGPAVNMEDDIQLVPNFRRRLEAAIAERPDVVIQFFSMRKADLEVGSRWDRKYCMLQCTYFPPGYSAGLRQFAVPWRQKHDQTKDWNACDYMVDDWLRSRREQYWIHVPSLVDHQKFKSAIDPRRSSARQSPTFKQAWANQ